MFEGNVQITYVKTFYNTVKNNYKNSEKDTKKNINKSALAVLVTFILLLFVLGVNVGVIGKLFLLSLTGYVFINYFYKDVNKHWQHLKKTEKK